MSFEVGFVDPPLLLLVGVLFSNWSCWEIVCLLSLLSLVQVVVVVVVAPQALDGEHPRTSASHWSGGA